MALWHDRDLLPIVAGLVRFEQKKQCCGPQPEQADRAFVISISGYTTRMEGAIRPNTPLLVSITSHPPSSHLAMSSTLSSSSNFQSIFDAALSEYTKQTGIDLTVHPSAQTLQNSSSVDAILALLEDKAKRFQAYRDGNRKLIKCLKPVVQVLHTVSGIFGEAASLVSLTNRGIVSDRVLTVLFPGSIPTYKSNLCCRRCPSHCAYNRYLPRLYPCNLSVF